MEPQRKLAVTVLLGGSYIDENYPAMLYNLQPDGAAVNGQNLHLLV
jgi:hypothetical protein